MKILYILSATPELSAANALANGLRFPLMAPSSTLLILNELTKAANYSVEILDSRLFMRISGGNWTLDYDAVENAILTAKPDFVGISFMSASVDESFEIAAICRKLGIRTIAGGLHPKVAEKEVAAAKIFDYIYQGEAETDFLQFVENISLENPENSSDETQIVRGSTLVLKEMNRVPAIRDFSYYAEAMRQYAHFRSVYIELSRGCVKNCSFCEVAKTGDAFKPFRPIPLEKIYETLENAVAQYGANYLLVSDSIATLHKKHFLEFIAYVGQNFPALTIHFNSTVDCWSEEIAKAVKDLKCNVWFGFESGSQKILDFISKGTTVGQAQKAAEICREYKIPCGFNILLGLPTETRDDYEKTFDFIRRNENVYPNPNILNPLPGTEIFRFCKAKDLLRYDKNYKIWNNLKIIEADYLGPVKTVDYKMVIEFYDKFSALQNQPSRSLMKI